MKNQLIILASTALLTSCSAQSATSNDYSHLPVYNQAYQENFKPDNFKDILASAKNAYILADPFSQSAKDFIKSVKGNNNQISAYISIGTAEDWRADFKDLKPYVVKKEWEGWEGEYFVSKIDPKLVGVMKKRIDYLAKMGFDWVEFDNMDWAFDNDNRKKYDFKATSAEAISYFQGLCTYALSKNIKCMAKNHTDNVKKFDGVTFESFEDNKNWWDEESAKKFLNKGKLFIINHYNSPNCNKVHTEYKNKYNNNISFICEDSNLGKYVHYNQ